MPPGDVEIVDALERLLPSGYSSRGRFGWERCGIDAVPLDPSLDLVPLEHHFPADPDVWNPPAFN
jgi:hypothetical protein